MPSLHTGMPRSRSGASWCLVALICVVFPMLRGPVMYRQLPAQDEDYFAVPGYTILQEGIPRIPYMPSRNPDGAFYRADEVLYALPPLYFYWQAAVYSVLGPSTGNARLAAALAGMAAVWVTFALGRQWFRDDGIALWGAGLFAFSRIVYFPCLVARPDMQCGLFGLSALWLMGHWMRDRRPRWLVATGTVVGLGALTHPFAIVYALQVGVWGLVAGEKVWPRIQNGLLLAVPTVMVLALLWGPLIAVAPETFTTQFGNNVLGKSGPGLISRLLLPLDSFRVQSRLFLEHTGPIQATLMLAGTLFVVWRAWRTRDPGWITACAVTLSGCYLLIAANGRHPTKGYWCYAGAPMWLCTGALVLSLVRKVSNRGRGGRVLSAGLAMTFAAAMLPGSGIRTVVAHVRHWDDLNYNAPRFTHSLIESLPRDGRFAVDPGYVFQFYLEGRDTVVALYYPFFFDVSQERYDWLVGGYSSLRDGVPEVLEAEFVRPVGDADDLFACYAEIYRAPPHRRPEPR